MTYNQAPYIEDAMNGFTMQETNFPFVCCIVDDASADGEPEVINNYLKAHFDLDDVSIVRREETTDYNLIFARHMTNRNCYFAVLFLKYNHYSNQEKKQKKFSYISKWIDNARYIALCEGDDYWIDDLKLQRQVDLLDSDSNCSLCYHACKNIFEDNYRGVKIPVCESVMETLTYKAFMPGYPFQTASVVYRSSIRNSSLYKNVKSNGTVSSAILFITIGQFGYYRGFNEQMAVYRRNAGGISVKYKDKNWKLYLMTQVNICGFFTRKVKYYFVFKTIGPMLFNLFQKSKKEFLQMAMYSIKRHPSILISFVSYITTIYTKRVFNRIFYHV
jgi:hypothetical protein